MKQIIGSMFVVCALFVSTDVLAASSEKSSCSGVAMPLQFSISTPKSSCSDMAAKLRIALAGCSGRAVAGPNLPAMCQRAGLSPENCRKIEQQFNNDPYQQCYRQQCREIRQQADRLNRWCNANVNRCPYRAVSYQFQHDTSTIGCSDF